MLGRGDANALFGYAQDVMLPSGVTSCVAARLFPEPSGILSDHAIVVARTSVLQVYGIIRGSVAHHERKARRLVLLNEEELSGTICDLAVARYPRLDRDVILVSFFDAKVSVLQYDMELGKLVVRSMHYFEREEYQMGFTQQIRGPWLSVDPQNRCAVALVYDRNLAVMPIEDSIFAMEEESASSVGKDTSYVFRLREMVKEGPEDTFSQEQKEFELEAMTFLHTQTPEPCLFVIGVTDFAMERKSNSGPAPVCTAMAFDIRARTRLWSVPRLPKNCTTACAVLNPIGGALVLSSNVIVYCSQRVTKYLPLNDYGVTELEALGIKDGVLPRSSLEEQLEEQRVIVPLNPSNPDVYILSTRFGDMYYIVLNCVSDIVQSISLLKMDVSNLANSLSLLNTHLPIVSCMCPVPSEKLLFIGSRTSDSILVKFGRLDKRKKKSKKSMDSAEMDDDTPKVPSVLSDDLLDDDDGDAFFDDSKSSSSRSISKKKRARENFDEDDESASSLAVNKRYLLVLEDYLIGAGTFRDFVVTESHDKASASLAKVQQSVLQRRKIQLQNTKCARWELVGCCGYGPTGALYIIQNDVRPIIHESFDADMAGSLSVWTLPLPAKQDPSKDFMLISQAMRTIVFGVNTQEFVRLAESGFVTDAPTIYTETMMDNNFVVQVHSRGLVMLSGTLRVQEWVSPDDFVVVSARALGSFIVVVSQDGKALLIRMEQECSGAPPVVAATAEPPTVVPVPDPITCSSLVLYGKRTLLVVAHMSGIIEVFIVKPTGTTPSEMMGKPVFVAGIGNFDSTVYNHCGSSTLEDEIKETVKNINDLNPPLITEVAFLVPAPNFDAALHMFVVLDTGDLVVYRSIPEYSPECFCSPDFRLRFIRINHRALLREPQAAIVVSKTETRHDKDPIQMLRFLDRGCHFVPYLSGFIYCAKRPAYIYNDHGLCRVTPMEIDGPIHSAASFNNGCFVALTGAQGMESLRICEIGQSMTLETSHPFRRIHLGETPTHIDYDSYHKMLIVAVSIRALVVPEIGYESFLPEEEKKTAPPPKPGVPIPSEKYAVWLINPRTDFSRVSELKLPQADLLTALTVVSLNNPLLSAQVPTTTSATGTVKNQTTSVYVAIGITRVVNERFQCMHQLIIDKIHSEKKSNGEYEYTLEDVCTGNMDNKKDEAYGSGPLTALSSCFNGKLLVGVRNTLYTVSLKATPDGHGCLTEATKQETKELIPSSITEIHSRNKSVLVINAWKGLMFLEIGGVGDLPCARECRRTYINASQFIRDLKTMITADVEGNIFISEFEKEASPIVPRADFHLGGHIGKFVRLNTVDPLRNASSSLSIQPPQKVDIGTRLYTVYTTFEGSMGFVRVIDGSVYRDLWILQERMINNLPHPAGLNPRQYRLVHHTTTHQAPIVNRSKRVLDGNILMEFLSLPYDKQVALSDGTPEVIISALAEIMHSVNYLQ